METDWGTRIREYRSRNGLTQQALADDLGVDRTTIIRWEKGKDEPALMFRRKILAWAPTVPEGVVSGLIQHVDHLEGFATLLDAKFRVLRTSRKHQEFLGYDASELYGRPSEPYWSEQMTEVIKMVGGLKGYQKNGIRTMDLALVRTPQERAKNPRLPAASIGRTVTIGDVRNPICYLTTMSVTFSLDNLPPNRIESVEGLIPLNLKMPV